MTTLTSFGAQLDTLPKIFQNRFFTIPDYQRSYAWDEQQVEELLKDLGHLLDDGAAHRHYTGTLVLTRAGAAQNNNQEYHVVDGQQRLTTLVIVLRVLSDYLPEVDRPVYNALYLRRGGVGVDRFVLRLNSDTRKFFERVVMGNGNPNIDPVSLEAHERLLKARKLISAWLAERVRSGTSIEPDSYTQVAP